MGRYDVCMKNSILPTINMPKTTFFGPYVDQDRLKKSIIRCPPSYLVQPYSRRNTKIGQFPIANGLSEPSRFA
jgi:CubicO group peptidase (beta-lactamase class C family)